MLFYCLCTNIVKDRDIHDYLYIYLPPVVVVVTFILGYVISNAINKNQEHRRLKRVFDFFQLYYENQIKSIKKQIIFIKEQEVKVSQLKNTNGLDITLINQPYFILDSIKKEELFSAWIDIMKKDSQSLINILTYIEFTKKSFIRYSEHHKGFLERQDEIRLKWNSKITEFHKIKVSLTSSPIEVLKQNKDLIMLNHIYNEWCKYENTHSLKDTLLHLVMPLIEYFEPIYKKSPDNQIAIVLIAKAQEIDITYKEWESEISRYDAYLKNFIEVLEKDTNKMSDFV